MVLWFVKTIQKNVEGRRHWGGRRPSRYTNLRHSNRLSENSQASAPVKSFR